MKKILIFTAIIMFSASIFIGCTDKNENSTITVQMPDGTKLALSDKGHNLNVNDTISISRYVGNEGPIRPSDLDWHIMNNDEDNVGSDRREIIKVVVVRKTPAAEVAFRVPARNLSDNTKLEIPTYNGLDKGDMINITRRVKGMGTSSESHWHPATGSENEEFEFTKVVLL